MRKRFRKVVREGWHVVQLNRANLWNWTKQQTVKDAAGDAAHYRHIRSWCNNTFAKDSWEERMLNTTWHRDTSSSVVTKEFAFRNEQDKTLFELKWLQ